MTSHLANEYPRFLRSLYERLTGYFRLLFSFEDSKAGTTGEEVGFSAFHWPVHEQQFCSFPSTEYVSVLPWTVDFELHTFAPALVVHGVSPRREA